MRQLLIVVFTVLLGLNTRHVFAQSTAPSGHSAPTVPKKPVSPAAVPTASKPSQLTVGDVIKMLEARLSETIIVGQIKKSNTPFDLTPAELITLKKASASDSLIEVLLDPSKPYAPPVPVPPPSDRPPALAPPAPPVPETKPTPVPPSTIAETDIPANVDIGAYYKKGGKWEEMLPEVVNWKTGGVMKSIASAGIVKGDVNGHIPEPHSRNSANSPLEVLICAPEGIAITEYQLIHLREQSNSREFRTVTGGVMHVSGGATRDVVPFEGKKVANRMYKILLPTLGAGEYGFLPPGAFTSANSASIGKMYTFRLVE